jgi:hypothetical protein
MGFNSSRVTVRYVLPLWPGRCMRIYVMLKIRVYLHTNDKVDLGTKHEGEVFVAHELMHLDRLDYTVVCDALDAHTDVSLEIKSKT